MNNRSALRRLVPLKWQRVFEHSRRIKYYRVVLRRFRNKIFLLGKQGTLICKKSVPFLFVATVSSLLYLLCRKFNLMDLFHALLEKVGFSLGGRALSFALRGLGCSGGLTLAIVFSIRALLSGEAAPSLEKMMLPTGAGEGTSAGAAPREAATSEAGPGGIDLNQFPNLRETERDLIENLESVDKTNTNSLDTER